MIILPIHRTITDTYIYVVMDCQVAEIEEMLDYCHTVCTGNWHHTFNAASPIWNDRSGSLHFNQKRDASLFKLRYFDAFD